MQEQERGIKAVAWEGQENGRGQLDGGIRGNRAGAGAWEGTWQH